ncbi:MAG: hypothetical protein IKS31_01470 [Clostridia bacterium]|nr:hypothetical protein [Clostridia bacterium]
MEEQKTFAFHLAFSDGANPYYHFPTSEKKHRSELRRWRRRYALQRIQSTESYGTVTEWYQATEKTEEKE